MEREHTASAQQDAEGGGGGGSGRLLAAMDRILALWEQRLREEVPAATAERHPILIDTMPALLEQLAEALSPGHPRPSVTKSSTIAEEHGGERVRVTRFRLQDLIAEYKVLREVLVTVLDEHGALATDERNILHTSIDEAMTKACLSYVLVQEGIREQVFAVLAHDLRGPLSAASVGLAMILRNPSSKDVPRWAAGAARGIDRVDRMVRDLLDAARAQAGGRMALELEECDLVDITRETVEQLQAEHGDRFVLVGPEVVRGYFARDALRRGIENLASNAVKYGGTSQPITITVRELHGRAIITVHNEGSYVPIEQQETIFRAFHRSQSAAQGTKRGWGLGLAQVRAVAEAHGGSIAIDSAPDRGTTFTIDIPVDARPYQCAPTTPCPPRR